MGRPGFQPIKDVGGLQEQCKTAFSSLAVFSSMQASLLLGTQRKVSWGTNIESQQLCCTQSYCLDRPAWNPEALQLDQSLITMRQDLT